MADFEPILAEILRPKCGNSLTKPRWQKEHVKSLSLLELLMVSANLRQHNPIRLTQNRSLVVLLSLGLQISILSRPGCSKGGKLSITSFTKKPLTRFSKPAPGVHGKRGLERGWQRRLAKGWRKVGKGLAKGLAQGWRRVGRGWAGFVARSNSAILEAPV